MQMCNLGVTRRLPKVTIGEVENLSQHVSLTQVVIVKSTHMTFVTKLFWFCFPIFVQMLRCFNFKKTSKYIFIWPDINLFGSGCCLVVVENCVNTKSWIYCFLSNLSMDGRSIVVWCMHEIILVTYSCFAWWQIQ